MARKKRPVADRQIALEPLAPKANATIEGVRPMYAASGGKQFNCTIAGYCRTRIFEFPRIDLHLSGDEPHHIIYSSPSVQACVATDLVDYFEKSNTREHYAISPSLRHEVGTTEERIRSQQSGRAPVFLVIEESSPLTPVEMNNGECSVSPEVVERDGERVPILVGGRYGEEFITAWATVDGAWPVLPNIQLLINTILAGVRVGQQTTDPIRKYLDQTGLVTDDGRLVEMIRLTMSARGSTATVMDATAYRSRVFEISRAIDAMEQEIDVPHFALLVNSMFRDEYNDDAYQRLHYLGLWQSLVDAARRCLNYQGNIREDQVVVSGNRTLQELKTYRNDIAHWWTDTIDESLLADLQRTTNELIHRKYF